LGKILGEELPLLRRIAGQYAEAEVSVSFLSPSEMRDVNKRYRGVDEPTDVLAFPLLDWEEEMFAPSASLGLLPLGDVLICPEEAEREHAPLKRPEALCLMLAHGFLHLLGWDHDTPEAQRDMWERQELIKSRLFDALAAAGGGF
jgi:probable rRNA maturation factor